MICKIYAARRYKSPREGRLTPTQEETRDVAYDLRVPTRSAITIAADEMERFVSAYDVLVPIPDHRGDTSANLALARAIGRRSGARVCDALRRHEAVPSTRVRRLRGKPPLPPRLHRMYARRDCPTGRVLVVDNVVTSGTTAMAATIALHVPCAALVWARHPTHRKLEDVGGT